MENGIKLKSGRIRVLFEYDNEKIDIEHVLKELREDYSIDAFYHYDAGFICVETIDDKYKSIDELVSLVNDIVLKTKDNKDV